jgi:hypothetical protein
MKKTYETPDFELILIESEDVIVTSYVPGPDEGEPDPLY